MDQIENRNLLYNKDFRFEIQRLPHITYFLTDVEIPDVQSQPVIYPTPFTDMKVHGDKPEFSPLVVTFNIDEDLRNYQEILDWIYEYSTPDNFKSYLGDQKSTKSAYKGHYSQGTIFTSTNKDNPNIQFVFEDLFPISIGSLHIDIQNDGLPPLTCSATFAYTKFTLQRG